VGTRTALLVEDDPELLAAMVAYVKTMLRLDVHTAHDYLSAIHQLETHTPDIISVDLQLPRESGYELCEHIRSVARLARLPILVTGEEALPQAMAQAEEAGANAFLEKPFSMVSLVRNLSALLDRPKMSRPGFRLLRLP
jgi:DNA-binding response OmpR family regulator